MKCKAKTKDGVWECGFLFIGEPPLEAITSKQNTDKEYFLFYNGPADWGMPRPIIKTSIDKDTICRALGRTDKTGCEVFEHDIIIHPIWGKREIVWGASDVTGKYAFIFKGTDVCVSKMDKFVVVGNTFDKNFQYV